MVEDISDIVHTHGFWNKVDELCKVMGPLVHILKIIDQVKKKKPTMAVIYEAIDRTNESIRHKLLCSYNKY